MRRLSKIVALRTLADAPTQAGAPAHPFHDGDSLLDVIIAAFGIGSVSRACDDGSCGACRVLLNGEVTNACTVRWGSVPEGASLETYEDLEGDPAARRAVDAFQRERPTRCSLCVGALGVTAVALSRTGMSGDARSVEGMLAQATCMCTGRGSLRRALMKP
jgi:aerobic-type carbon monoxide dehydrogenase small subunit (CoxS/CutS family)